jgi:hypothetical protein
MTRAAPGRFLDCAKSGAFAGSDFVSTGQDMELSKQQTMSDRLVAATRNCDRPSVGNLKCVVPEKWLVEADTDSGAGSEHR